MTTSSEWKEPTYPPELELNVDGNQSGADAPERWRWLASTRELQRVAYGHVFPKEGASLADWVMMNHTALVKELSEALDEVGWKPWADGRGWVNRDAFIKELVDAGHFLANLAVAVGCTDQEWEERYRDKQALNLQRQESGYDGLTGKCHACHRALDDGGLTMRQNPRREGSFQYVCSGCGAIQSDDVIAQLDPMLEELKYEQQNIERDK